MRFALAFAAILLCAAAGGQPSELERLQRELKVAAPPEQFPDHADYTLLPKVCNEKTCFLILAVRVPAALGPRVRLAVFSENEHYIGSYAGLRLVPSRVTGDTLHFATTLRVYQVRFERNSPPADIQIDGEVHAFERAR